MRNTRALVAGATFVLGSLTMGVALANPVVYSAVNCARAGGGAFTYSLLGTEDYTGGYIRNIHSTQNMNVVCPIVGLGGTIATVDVHVYDQHSSEAIDCSVQCWDIGGDEVGVYGSAAQSSDTSDDTFTFEVDQYSGAGCTLWCELPDVDTGYSTLFAYRVTPD
jgi:hypothetical protein